jgi:hypothetical protein
MTAAADLGFTERVRFATGSQVPVRLLIQTGQRLEQLTLERLAQVRPLVRAAMISYLWTASARPAGPRQSRRSRPGSSTSVCSWPASTRIWTRSLPSSDASTSSPT